MPVAALMQDAAGIMTDLDALALCTAQSGEITRLFLTPTHQQAVALVRSWMGRAGLSTRLDASGTLVGARLGSAPGAPLLLLGSHIDSVRNAGRYDGCLGVAIAIAAAARLRDMNLPYALEIRAFGDEEGVRFPVTLTGAHATAGTFDPAWLDVQDADGIALADALKSFDLDPAGIPACTATGAFAYLEVHIEQGPVLEAKGAPLGIVTAISGAARFDIVLTGRAGHAGTVPMDQRADALVAASAMVLAIRRIACAHNGCVATVGQLSVLPGATNVIPGLCRFTIDLRASDDTIRDQAEQSILAAGQVIADEHRVALSCVRTHQAPAVACDSRLQAQLAQAMAACDVPVHHLPSGAGHDAMAVAALCPVGMLFVRCAGGVSHHPGENVTQDDVGVALDVLTHVLTTLDPAFIEGCSTPN